MAQPIQSKLKEQGCSDYTSAHRSYQRIHMDYPVMVGHLIQRYSVGHRTDHGCLHIL